MKEDPRSRAEETGIEIMKKRNSASRFIARSLLVAGLASALAMAVNAGRPDSLALVARSEYEIFDECPEGEESAPSIALEEILENRDYFFLVDSRMPEEFERFHVEGALSIPYDPLFSVTEEDVSVVREDAGDRTVVVLGDSLTSRLLANDFINQGLDWVHFLEEGEDWMVLLKAGD